MRVLISGYYGFGNLGDEALLTGIVTTLKGSGHNITVLSGNPESTKKLHEVNAVHRYKAVFPALLNCDALVSGGGGLLQDHSSRRSLQYYLWLIRLAKLFRKRVLVYGQSIGPLSDWGKLAVASTLKNIPIAVRDERSQALLSSLNLNSELIADAALLIPKPRIIQKDYTLLVPRHGYPFITEALIEAARALQNQNQAVALASVQANEDKIEIAKILEVCPDIPVLDASTPQTFLAHIAKAKYVISGRLHGLILAAVANVDYAGLVYDPKVRAFLEETGAVIIDKTTDTKDIIKVILEKPEVDMQKLELVKARAESGKRWLEKTLS